MARALVSRGVQCMLSQLSLFPLRRVTRALLPSLPKNVLQPALTKMGTEIKCEEMLNHCDIMNLHF